MPPSPPSGERPLRPRDCAASADNRPPAAPAKAPGAPGKPRFSLRNGSTACNLSFLSACCPEVNVSSPGKSDRRGRRKGPRAQEWTGGPSGPIKVAGLPEPLAHAAAALRFLGRVFLGTRAAARFGVVTALGRFLAALLDAGAAPPVLGAAGQPPGAAGQLRRGLAARR